tara:strand:+ start:3641 stop:4177 length:537 start_codon:yes stop_codon:yes gene_type:complete
MFRTIFAAVAAFFIASTAHADQANTQYIETQIGSTVRADSGRDNSGVVGITVGKDLGDIRVSLAGVRNSSGDATTLGEVELDALVGGAYYDINTNSKFTPFVGVNAGYGWADGAGVVSANDSGIVYGASLGVGYKVTDTIDLVTSYQYLTSNTITVTNSSGNEDWDSQAVTAGVRFRF